MGDGETGATAALLRHLRAGDAPQLGQGDEATVYAYGDDRVVRVFKRADGDALEQRRLFYEQLAAQPLPVAFPRIESLGCWRGTWYTVERRLVGQNLATLLPQLEAAARRRALLEFLDAVDWLRQAPLPVLPAHLYGEVIALPAVRATSWRAFLRRKVYQRLGRAAADLATDGIDLHALRRALQRALAHLPQELVRPQRCLVHGDYWPPNVLVDETLRVTAIVDFGGLTVVGDHLQDVAGAIIFAGDLPGVTPEDAQAMEAAALRRHGERMAWAVRFYRGYYAVLFAIHKHDAPRAYTWSLRALRGLTAVAADRD